MGLLRHVLLAYTKNLNQHLKIRTLHINLHFWLLSGEKLRNYNSGPCFLYPAGGKS